MTGSPASTTAAFGAAIARGWPPENDPMLLWLTETQGIAVDPVACYTRAVEAGCFPAVLWLVGEGVDPSVGLSPGLVDEAIMRGSVEIVRWMHESTKVRGSLDDPNLLAVAMGLTRRLLNWRTCA